MVGRALAAEEEKWWRGGGTKGKMRAHLPPNHNHTPIRRPRDRQTLPSQLHSRRAGLTPHVPKPARAITAHRRQFRLFRRIPSYSLNTTGMPSQLRAVFHLRLLRIPYPQRAICRACGYEVARGIPGDGADAEKSSRRWRYWNGRGRWTYVRVGTWTSSGGVVVCLDFEGWEEGGEAVFGYGSSRVGWGHCEGRLI